MAKKLNLDEINTERAETQSAGADKVHRIIDTGAGKKGQQSAAEPDEIAKRRSELRTQGRAGAKAIRINMAFTPENHDYIKTMATVTGKSMTEFCNYICDIFREEHADTYTQAKDFLQQLK